MAVPGDTLGRIFRLGTTPDAAPVVRVFRNGIRTDTITLSGVATEYLVTYTIPSAWAATDFIQIIAYPLFGGQQYSTQLFGERLGSDPIVDSGSSIVSAALVCDQVPDATPSVTTWLDGVASVATLSISAGAVAGEYLVSVNAVSVTTGYNLEAWATPVFGGESYPTRLWSLAILDSPRDVIVTGEDGLIHSPAEVLQRLLIDTGVLTEAGTWPGWSTNEHDTPDDAVTIYDTVGTEDGRTMNDGQFWAHYGLMIRVRSKVHGDGVVKCRELRQHLSGSVRNRTVTVPTSGSRTGATYVVVAVTKIGQPTYLGSDVPNSRRKLFTINATVALRRVVS